MFVTVKTVVKDLRGQQFMAEARERMRQKYDTYEKKVAVILSRYPSKPTLEDCCINVEEVNNYVSERYGFKCELTPDLTMSEMYRYIEHRAQRGF